MTWDFLKGRKKIFKKEEGRERKEKNNMAILDDIKITVLDENKGLKSLNSLRDGKAMVLDFWTTKCVKCPAALEKLNDEAGEDDSGEILYVSCALSQGDGNMEMVTDLVDDWQNMTHVFMDIENKDIAKAAFKFTQVPFYVVVSATGDVVDTGDPKSVDFRASLQAAAKPEMTSDCCLQTSEFDNAAPAAVHTFSLDEDF